MSSLNYHHLYYFAVIAKAGSITRACEILHLSQPGLSAQLKRFETVLKRRLFERHKKRLRLTEEGRMVLDYAERIFDMGQQLEDALRDRPPGGHQSVQIGVMTGTPRAFTDALVEKILKHHAGAHVLIEEGPIDVLAGKLMDLSLDVLLTDTPVSDSKGIDCANTRVGRIPVVFAATPSVARAYAHAFEKQMEVPIILPTAPAKIYQKVQGLLADGRVHPRIVAEVQDMEIAARLACRGHGIAPLGMNVRRRPPFVKALIELKWDVFEPITETIYLVTRNRQWPNPIASYLVDHFRING